MRKTILRLVTLLTIFALVAPLTPARAQPPAQEREPERRQEQERPEVDARIEIVFPHDARGNVRPVPEATLVNVEVFLFQRGTLNPVACNFSNEVKLRWARNAVRPDGTAEQIPAHDLPGFPSSAEGQRTIRLLGGRVFPAWVFNDVPIVFPTAGASLALSKTFFFVEIDDANTHSNIWSHGADPRTFSPSQFNPPSVTNNLPSALDALIQVVFPHDLAGRLQPVTDAPLANVAVDLFEHPLGPSVGFNFNRRVRLFRALNAGLLDDIDTVQTVARTVGALTFPRFEFNNVDVAAATNPANKFFFADRVDGTETHTTIWAHGAEGRTIFPEVDVPATSGANCPR